MGSQFKSTGIEINGGGSFGGRGHELVAGEPHLGGPDVGEPGGPAGAAACVVALQEIGDHLGTKCRSVRSASVCMVRGRSSLARIVRKWCAAEYLLPRRAVWILSPETGFACS